MKIEKNNIYDENKYTITTILKFGLPQSLPIN